MEIKKLAGAVAAGTVMFSVGAVAPASAADSQVFGLQQTVGAPNGGEIAYTVTKLMPSGDAIPYPVSGQLYEATVRADALNGLVTPVVPAFSAQTEGGASYPALANVWTPLSSAVLLPGGASTGKVYFDAAGDAPTSVVYNGDGATLTWIEPAAEVVEEEEAAAEEEAPAEEAAPEDEAAAEEEIASEADSSDNAVMAEEEEE